jgi:hypothetical protein
MSSALVAALHVLLLAILLVDVFPWLGSRRYACNSLSAMGTAEEGDTVLDAARRSRRRA